MRNLVLVMETAGVHAGWVWVSDGILRRHVEDEKELAGLEWWIEKMGGDDTVHSVLDIRVFGRDIDSLTRVVPEIDYDRLIGGISSQTVEHLQSLRFVASQSDNGTSTA